jgi:hypothetical protein
MLSAAQTRIQAPEDQGQARSNVAGGNVMRQPQQTSLGILKATGATQPYNTAVNPFYTSQALI